MVLGQADWRLMAFSPAFVTVGAVMVAVIMTAAGKTRRRSDSFPSRDHELAAAGRGC
jgi:hypothetical protein